MSYFRKSRKGISVLEVLIATFLSTLLTLAVLIQIKELVRDKKLEREISQTYDSLSSAEYVMKTDLMRIGDGMLLNAEGKYAYPIFSWNGVDELILRGGKADEVSTAKTVMVNCGGSSVAGSFSSDVVGYNAYVLGQEKGCYVNGRDSKVACAVCGGEELVESPFFEQPNGCCVESGTCNRDVACFKTTYEFKKDGDFYVLSRNGIPLIKNVGSFGVFYSLDENGDGKLEPTEMDKTGPVAVNEPNQLKSVFVVMVVKVDYLKSNVGIKDDGANLLIQVGKTTFSLKKPLNWRDGRWMPVVVAVIPTEKQAEKDL